MHVRLSTMFFLVSIILNLFSSSKAVAASEKLTQQMLDSTVCVECIIRYQDKAFTGGSGTGFLVADSEYVITNNHVIDSCDPDDKLLGLHEYFYRKNIEDYKQGKLTLPPKLEKQLKGKSKSQRSQIINNVLIKAAEKTARSVYANSTQELRIVVTGKEKKQKIVIAVDNITWGSSKTRNQTAWEIGTDLAILKLNRKLINRPSVNFATGSSVKVGDKVFAVGYPGVSREVVPSARYIPTFKEGTVSKLGGESPYLKKSGKAKGLKGVPVIEISAAISQGNSGGPLFNEFGEVLGINSFGHKDNAPGFAWAQDIAIAIPIMKDLGLTMPNIRTKPRNWLDNNKNLVKIGGFIVVVILVLYGIIMFMKLRSKKNGLKTGHTPTPVASSNPAVKGIKGEFSGISVPIPASGLKLGYSGQEAGRLGFADKSVSQQHCIIDFNPASNQFEVTDLDSTNGTFVFPEGKKLQPHHKHFCRAGDLIRLGRNNEFELTL